MRFEFSTATRIVFGCGAALDLVASARQLGTHALVVTGSTPQRTAALLEGLPCSIFSVEGEPSVDLVRTGVRQVRDEGVDLIVAIGGGSAIDAGKAVAALAANNGDVLDYLEVVGKGRSLARPALPLIAVPTTAGAGSEVTRNAVLASPEHRVKASLRSSFLLPRLAVVDPDLTLDLTPAVTASTGLDALTQLIEPYVSTRANAMTDMFAVEGIARAARALSRAYAEPRNREARSDMAFASLLGGLSLANAGLGVVHGFAAPVGGMFPAPHGAVCAALLPYGMAANIRALRARSPSSEALRRYERIARILTNSTDATPEDGVAWVSQTCRGFAIPPLSAYGIGRDDVPALVAAAARASSMIANPIALTEEELAEVVTRAL